jgi:polyferredoxin
MAGAARGQAAHSIPPFAGVLFASLLLFTLLAATPIQAQPGVGAPTDETKRLTGGNGAEPFPELELPLEQTGMTVDGIAYPVDVLQGHLEFTRRQARMAGDERRFYEWGEILHIYDTAAERLLAARAAWQAGFRVTEDDMRAFAAATIDASPGYLEELYGGSREFFSWDARLQILMKKWMAYQTHQVPLDISWQGAGRLIEANAQEFEVWGAWHEAARKKAEMVTYPERLERQEEPPPRWGVLMLLGLVATFLALWLRAVARSGERSNLLERWPALRSLSSRRLHPEGLRALMLGAFLLVLAALFLGPPVAHRNLGSVYLWILWWPLVPFVIFFTGRSWCAVCPVATLTDLIQKLPFARRGRPARLALAGVWLIDGTFILITWFDRSFGLVGSTKLTLTALLLLLGAALTTALLFERRTFCRHGCFFGAFAGNYSLASMVELRPSETSCRGCGREACLKRDAPGACPMFERPRALTSSRHCNLCLTCLRECKRGALALRVRDPLGEISSVRRPDLALAVLAAILVGVVAVQNLGMLEVAGTWERRLQEMTGLGRSANTTLLYIAALVLPVALLATAARFRPGRMALFGYLLIPLDLGAHAAHNLLHLLGEGQLIWWVTASLLGLSSPLDVPGGHPGGSMGAALLDVPTIRALQVGLVLLAAGASFALARRAQRRFRGEISLVPAYGLLLVLLAANLWLFSNPMALRH